MLNFDFHSTTKIIFGRETENRVGEEAKRFANKALLHYGKDSIKRSGLYDRVVKSLKDAGIEIVELSGVVPNPRLSMVREGIEICRKQGIGLVLAVGGGSVIDSAKAIAFGAVSDADVWDEFFVKLTPVTESLPLGTILTFPAAGSEASPHTVISDADNERKLAAHGGGMLPKFSILNPELTTTLPAFQTAAGAVDMLTHIMERYFTPESHVDFTDHLCEGAMRSIIKNAPLVLDDPGNYDLRSELMLAGMVAHNDSLGVGRSGDWATHLIEHELSAIWDVTHGEGLAVMFPAWMEYAHQSNMPRFVRYAEEVFGIREGSDEQKVKTVIAKLREFYKRIGMRGTLAELGVEESKLGLMAERCCPDGTLGSIRPLSKVDIEEIYKLAM